MTVADSEKGLCLARKKKAKAGVQTVDTYGGYGRCKGLQIAPNCPYQNLVLTVVHPFASIRC